MHALELCPLNFMPLSGAGSALTPEVAPQASLDLLPAPAVESPPAGGGWDRGDGLSAPSGRRQSPTGSRGDLSGRVEPPGFPEPGFQAARAAVGGGAEPAVGVSGAEPAAGACPRRTLGRPQVNEAYAGCRAPLGAGFSPAARAPGAAFSAGCHSGVGRVAH